VAPIPSLSLAAGTYGSSQTETITDSNSAAKIYYTTDGTAPSASSTKYSAPFTVNASETVKAIAVISGYSNSTVASAAYTFVTPTPTFSLVGGTYYGSQTVTISDSNSGATIYYTTNGSTPTTSSTQYTGAITVSATETINAMAKVSTYSQSATATAAYTITTTSGTLSIFLSQPTAQSTTVAGAATETFDALTVQKKTTPYTSTAGIGTYSASSSIPFAILAHDLYGGATDSTSSTSTNYFAVGNASGSTSPFYITFTQPVSYFGFWWSAGDANNRIALYSGTTLYGTFSTADLLTFLNNGAGTITATNGTAYQTSAYFGNPNLAVGSNDSAEPFAYVSFSITGATITKVAFYNTNTSSNFESDNHSAIFNGNTVTIPTTFVPVENMSLGSQTVTVTVSPATATVSASGTQQFTATVTGSTNTAVNWSISPATGAGSINASGVYTAPTSVTTPQTVTITATSAANTAVSASGTVTLKATPTISVWPTPSSISIGQTLASSTLTGGTTSIQGTFAWTTPTTVPNGGTTSQSVTFTPTDTTNYTTVAGSVLVTVNKATPTISAWPTASNIYYGQTLASSTLSGGTSTPTGTFAFTTPTTAPGVGTAAQSVTFTPTDTTDYNAVVGSANVTVTKATPTSITWPTASGISYGQTLANSTLSGGASTPVGTFAFTTPTTAPGVGTAAQSVTFTPTDTADYNTVVGSANVTVTKATPTSITWPTASNISYGQTLANSILSGGSSTPAGSFAFTTSTTAPSVGTAAQSVTFTPTDTTDYNAVVGSANVTVTKATPTSITWPTASNISYGQTLANSILSGGSSTPAGSFAFTTPTTAPSVGTAAQSVTFTPTDTADYNTVVGSANVTITKAIPTVSAWPTASGITYGQTLASSTLTGGTATVAGTFAWTTPTTVPDAGTQLESVTFTPDDTTNYNTTTGSVSVTVSAPQCTASYQRTIVIDHTKVPNTDQVNFPFLFNTTNPSLATIANGGHVYSSSGNDIVFSADPTGATKLDYELEEYNPATGQIIAWVRIPTLSHTVDTPIYMFYGNSSITTPQQNPAGVWDANYLDILHLDETSGATVFDSTVHGNNGTKVSQSSPTAIFTGEIGRAQNFNGTSDFIILPPSMTSGLSVFSVGFWMNTNDNGSNGTYWNRPEFIGDSTSGNPSGDFGINTNSGDLGMWSGLNSAGDNSVVSGRSVSDGNWHRIDAVNNGSATELYLDGQDTGQNISSGRALDTYGWYLGAQHYYGGGAAFFHRGSLDEFHFSRSVRSSDWIATEYNNQSSPSTFYSLSTETLDSIQRLTPSAVTLYALQNQKFAMLGVGTCSPVEIDWAITPQVGTINAAGLYSTPSAIPTQQIVTVTATNTANNVTAPPAAVTLLPSSSGPVGTVFTINGAGGFGSAEGASGVTVGGLPAMTLSWSDTQIQVQIPSGVGLGLQDVQVTVGGQLSADVKVNVTPGLTGITPAPAGTPASFTISTAGQQAPLLFNGTAGQYVFAQVSNSTFPGEYWGESANLNILNPNGSVLYSWPMGGGGGSNVINSIQLPTTGIYTFVFAPISPGTGSADLSIGEFGEQTGTTLSPGVPVTVTINNPGQDDQLTFYGQTGQYVFVQVANSTFPNESWGQTVDINILKPDGSNLHSGSVGVDSGYIDAIALPTSGTYTLKFDPINGGTGKADITIWVFYEQSGTITPTIPDNIAIDIPGQAVLLTFSGMAGQRAGVQISNSTFPNVYYGLTANVSIVRPDGTNLGGGYIGVGSGSIGQLTLPTSGTYTLEFDPIAAGTGSATLLLTLSNPNVTMSASLTPAESWQGYPVSANISLTAKGGAVPTGTVSCSGAGVTSASVKVNPRGSATAQMNGLPIGKDPIVCSYASSNLAAFSNAVSSTMLETVIAAPLTGSVSITPHSATIYGGQTQQFSASVFNTNNQAVNWTISPSDTGTISATGLYAAPTSIASQQTATIIATSQADTTQSASAKITLLPPQCAASGYSYQRAIVIDHTKVPNADQADFPFLFNSTDRTFATTANGGRVTNSSGYDIVFSTDPGGLTKLDHELEQYNPATGQVTAWVRIPALSHSSDTVIYMFYGNPSITTSQQNPTGVRDSNQTAVYHFANAGTGIAADSTAYGNSATLTSVLPTTGRIDVAGGFNGTSSYMQIPASVFGAYPTVGSTTTDFSATFGAWFKTALKGVILGQDDGTTPGSSTSKTVPALYVDNAGSLRASLFRHGSVNNQIVTKTAYNDNNWHFVADAYTNGTEELYVDGQFIGSQQVTENGYSSTYAYYVGAGDTASWPVSNNSWLYFNGNLAEISVSKTARSGDWIQSEYNNQSSPATFYVLHPENVEEIVPSAVNLYASQSQQFTVLGSTAGSCHSPSVMWTMTPGLPGTLMASGLYTAPNSISAQQPVTISAITLGDSNNSISATAILMPPVTVSLTPASAYIAAGQTQQFTAIVNNASNTDVTWTINPGGAGIISSTGLFTAAESVKTQLTMNITATSQADPTQTASATITLSPTPITPIPPSQQCGSSGYSSQRIIVIDHRKVPNTDQVNFPFLFNTTDSNLATIASGGQVSSASGYDIIFSTDPNGLSKLDHELEQYDPASGQVKAWVRIPTLSHNTDTILYMFYGNPNITTSQENKNGVWDSDYTAVYHLANAGLADAVDSTAYANNGTLTAVSSIPGLIDDAGSFDGTSSYIQIPEADFPTYPTASSFEGTPVSGAPPFTASFGLWFKTATAGGILAQSPDPSCVYLFVCIPINSDPKPGDFDPPSAPMLYVDDNGRLEFDSGSVVSKASYNDNNWHYAVITYAANGTNTLYIDGQNAGSEQLTSAYAYSPDYAYFVGTAYTWLSELGNSDWLYFDGNIDEVTVSSIPRSSDWIQTEYNNQKSPSTFYTFNPASSAQVVPSDIILYGAQSQQFAASASCNASVTWSMSSGAPGMLTSSGFYTAPDSISAAQKVTITATDQTTQTTIGQSVVTLMPPPLPITLSATTQPPYITRSSQAFAATLKDQYGNAETGVAVTFIVSGANNSIGSITTDSDGVAAYSYAGANNGNDSIQATAVINGQLLTSSSISALWVDPVPQNSGGSVALIAPLTLGRAGLVGAFTDNNGAVIEPIAIGASSRVFVVPSGATQLQLGINDNHYVDNGGSGFVVKVNGDLITVPPTTMPWRWVQGTGKLNNNYQYAMNDGTGPVVAATEISQGDLVSIAYQSGTVSADFSASQSVDGDGDSTWITGVQLWQGAYYPTMYTTPSSYPVGLPITLNALVKNSSGTPISNIPVTLNISGANVEQLEATTDSTGTATFIYIGSNSGIDNLQAQALSTGEDTLVSGQAKITWADYATPPTAGSLAFLPNTILGPNNGQEYLIVAKDASGNPVFDTNVGFYVSGANVLSQGGTTDINGQVPFGFNHNPGAYSIVAVDSVDRNVLITNTLSGVWTPSTTSSPSGNEITVGVSALSTVTMPNTLQLNGTATDSLGNALTATWNEVSGPGNVIFSPAQQTVTNGTFVATASFSEVGSYVLKVTVSNGLGGSASVPVTVSVVPAQQDPQGWIGSPVYGSTVTGIVPITLVPGVTLQPGGNLIYYSASNPTSSTSLPITQNSGTISTLDTTTLQNGSYWIQLEATDTSGEQQYSLILVTVAGNYKPGRVTATVTDLVVPATGLAINIQRSYDSINASTSSDFGYGWSLGINTNLSVDPMGNVTFTLGGQRKTFNFQPNDPCTSYGGCLFYWLITPAWTPEPGLHGTLSSAGPGCASGFDVLVRDGSTWFCRAGGQYSPSGYIYTDPAGTSYTISAAGALQSIQDHSGNGLTITPNGITSTSGLSVPFVRDSANRITQITDPQGNTYQYGYDAEGNLATVTYPTTPQSTTCPSTPTPNTSTYTYDANHRYTGGTDGRCNPLPTSTYYPAGDASAGRLQSVTDAAGKTTSYAYDLATNTTTATNPDNGIQTLVYDSYGDLLSSTDPLGHTTDNVYDESHNLTSVTDPLGHKTSYTYDANGNKTSITYPSTGDGHNTTSRTAYNQYSEPISTTDELGNVRTFNYDANYLPTSVTDNQGTLASFIFNSDSTLAAGAIGFEITAQPSKASQFAYDTSGNMISRTDALGRTTSYTYDWLGHKLSTVTPTPTSGTGTAASTTTYQYDAMGNLVQTAAPLGRTTSSTYDSNGNKLSDTDARGKVTHYVYDALNRLIETDYPSDANTPATKSTKTYDFRNNVIDETDQAGNVTHHEYDKAGRLTSVTRGYGSSTPSATNYTYYDNGLKESETDHLKHITNYGYDATGRLTSVSGVQGTVTYGYDDAGNKISSTDGKSNTTNFKYDARKRLIETDYPDGTSVKNSYDGPGNLASVIDQNGNEVDYTYDAANQLKTVVQKNHPDSSHNTNSYSYDGLGNLMRLADENGHTTVNGFDLLNEPISKILPDQTHTETRQYDAAGNLSQLIHFDGTTTTYTYDALNHLLSRSSNSPNAEPAVSFTYTSTGKYLTSMAQDGTVNYTYDALDRLITKATPEGTLSYTYFPTGKVETITSSNPHGVSVAYTYDDLNRLQTVTDNRLSGNNTTTYSYDEANNVATVRYPNQLTSTFTYDSLNRLTELSTPPVADYRYTLGATGIRTNATEQGGRTLQWNYDNTYRLTGETVTGDAANNGNVDYTLDPVGNRIGTTSTFNSLTPGFGSYNANDQVSNETYDANGNTITASGKTFTYDSENHMTSMTNGTTVVTMKYDAFGNRVAKTVNGVTTLYLVEDDVNPTGYPQVVEELTGPIGAGVVTRTYTYGLQRISQNLSPTLTGNATWTPSFYGYDGFGTVRQLTDTAGTVTDTYEYDAYGNFFTKTGTTPNSYLYRGEQYDSDLALYYLRARYYNQVTGRFLSRDPKNGYPYDSSSLHKYLYASSDPVNRLDPLGSEAMLEYAGIINNYLLGKVLDKAAGATPMGQNMVPAYKALGICQAKVYADIAKVVELSLTDPAQAGILGQQVGPEDEQCLRDFLWTIITPPQP
jgi:RHS repeat-associated protein